MFKLAIGLLMDFLLHCAKYPPLIESTRKLIREIQAFRASRFPLTGSVLDIISVRQFPRSSQIQEAFPPHIVWWSSPMHIHLSWTAFDGLFNSDTAKSKSSIRHLACSFISQHLEAENPSTMHIFWNSSLTFAFRVANCLKYFSKFKENDLCENYKMKSLRKLGNILIEKHETFLQHHGIRFMTNKFDLLQIFLMRKTFIFK